MKSIKILVVAAAMLFSMGTAMAETDNHMTSTDGFHALSQVTSVDTQAMTALTDEQLESVAGGYTPNPFGPIIVVKKWPRPWPWPPCLSCPGPFLDNYKDLTIPASMMSSRVMGY